MNNSRINEWLQFVASFGVILGLLFVAYEIREANRIALGESIQEIQDHFREIEISEYETDIRDLYVKSIESPDDLSSAEILKLDSYLVAVISSYENWWRMNDIGLAELNGLDDLRGDVDEYFSSKFGRAWFARNSYWLWPEVSATVECELESLPVRTEPPYVEYYKSRL